MAESYSLSDTAQEIDAKLSKIPGSNESWAKIVEDQQFMNALKENISCFVASATEPTNKSALWIDTRADGGLKYYNGTSWVTVPVRFA